MIIRVKLFAAARQTAGREAVEVELPEAGTVADLRAAITTQFPALDTMVRHCLFAVNNQYVENDAVIPFESEVACIPPVSGG